MNASTRPTDDALNAALQRARSAWPTLHVDGFAAVLQDGFDARRVGAAVFWERLRPADLYLATAAVRRAPGAIEALSAAHGAVLERVARRFAGPRHPADDLVQLQLEALLVGSGARGPRLADYAGKGHLENWLRVTGSRLCLDRVRTGVQHRREQPGHDLSATALGGDLELDFIRDTYRPHFRAAFADAVAGLEPAERAVLKLAYLHGLSIDAIGRMRGVHRATAARRVARARGALLQGLRTALGRQLSVADAELDSLLGLLGSGLQVSLERLLRSTLA